MTYKGLWRLFVALGITFLLSACDADGQGTPAIVFDIPAGSNSIVTPDSTLTLSGTAESEHGVEEVTWSNDRGGSGVAQGGETWQIFNIALYVGDNQITVTASDAAGNTNSRSLVATRESATPTVSGADQGTDVSTPILMYSYDAKLKNPAPAKGAKINPGPVYFYVIPSDNWRNRSIDYLAYYCCDKPGEVDTDSQKLAVSREPWSMVIDLSSYAPGEKRGIDIEANLVGGEVLKAPDFDFTLTGLSPKANRPPSISGAPVADAIVGSPFVFRPSTSDADGDTLSLTVNNLPAWAKFDKLTGKLWGTPQYGDIGPHRNIQITVSDGKSSSALSPFSITVAPAGPSPGTSTNSNAPNITSFTATASAITRGDMVTLKWSVNSADSISISPQPGKVSGNSVSVAPTATTTYKLTASNASGSAEASVSVSVLSGSNDWTVSEGPPTLSSPRMVNVSDLNTVTLNQSDIHCGGKIYRISLANNQDAVVHMTGGQALKYPLHITGGRNVRVVGLQFEMVTQPGCGVGELPNRPIEQHPNSNIHPRLPGAIALRLQQSGTSFVEGLHIDIRGHEADCIVARNPDAMTDDQARSQRDVIIQNTYCSGVEGQGASDIGDGVHGDLFQNQGRDILRKLVFENVSMRSSQEGIVLHSTSSNKGAKILVLRRYDYTWDPRYVGDDNYESFGLAFAGWPDANGWTLDDIRIDDYRDGLDYLRINGQRYGNSPNSSVQSHPAIRSGRPAQGAFALPGRTGVNYVSPHGPATAN